MQNFLAMITKKVQNLTRGNSRNNKKKKFASKPQPTQKGKFSCNFNLFETNTDRSIQYRACDGFNHIQTQCPNYILKKKKAMQTIKSYNNDSSIDDEDIVGGLVHDKRLKLEDSDDQILKSSDISSPCDLRILPYNNVKISSMKSSDE